MKTKNRSVWRAFRESVERALQELYPGAGRYDRVVYARVVDVTQNPGQVTAYLKLWSVDLQVLTPDLESDPSYPVIKGVPIDPIDINQMGQALFQNPFPGLIVRMGWMYGNRAHPFVHSFTAEGLLVPTADRGTVSSLLFEAVSLLMLPRATAVGPGPYDGSTQAKITLLLTRIPQ